jgi:hypothetical protein
MPLARVCPYCRQSIRVERCGVPLPLLKAGIFDAIKQAGDVGVTSAEIVAGPLYRERRRASHDTIKAHIWQINELLEETNWVIRSEGNYGTSERRWYLRRRKVRRVA